MTDATLYSVESGIATITLNRPDNRNALSIELMNSLGDGLEKAVTDESVRVVVLTNEGNTFCAGANLKGETGDEKLRHPLEKTLAFIQDAPKPIVGRIAGHCTGGGNGLAAACDISISTDDVFFAFTEVRIGVAPAIISVVCLPKMRRGDALELFLTGNRISAARAAEIGLINRSVGRDELDAALSELCADLVAGGPNALAAAKQIVYRVPPMDRSDSFAWTAPLSAELFKSEEAAAGIAAFRERGKPPWVP
ncbi:MAG: enoyl-CoA hydratase/isomerase family protein [Actinomycetota bacterium]